MNVARFLDHWKILENPFIGEEARQDAVFARVGVGGGDSSGSPLPVPAPSAPSSGQPSRTSGPGPQAPIHHPDFPKILGDLARPSSSIVFGEKGSGKTAIRLQLAARIDAFNRANPNARVLLVSYDDLNPMLDRVCAAFKTGSDDEPPEVLKALGRLRLVDHLDAILHAAVPPVIDALLGHAPPGAAIGLPTRPWRVLKSCDAGVRRDLLVLQALYDRQPQAPDRTRIVRGRLRLPGNRAAMLWKGLAYFGWLLPVGVLGAELYFKHDVIGPLIYLYAMYGALALWILFLIKWFVLDRWGLRHAARRLRKQLRALPWTTERMARTLALLPLALRDPAILPFDDQEEKRYAMLARLRRVLAPLGYGGIVIILDRLDEPTIIAGDVPRMKAVIWPLLSNKLLQQEGVGVKLLLPVELRHELFRESGAFFQGARLDKQNLIERLSWSGPMLFDLCNARLAACRPPDAPPITLTDLFEQDVARQDVIDALEQMHQPRDAFKLIYQCLHEHCAAIPDESPSFRIPRATLDMVRKQQADRVSMFYRGIRPA